jgi:acetylornithine deacetylase
VSSPAVDAGSATDAYLADHRAELIELVGELVRIDSQIPPFADERRIAAFLRKHMSDLGLGDAGTGSAQVT